MSVLAVAILALSCETEPEARDYFTPSELQNIQQANELAFESEFINSRITLRGEVESVEERLFSGLRVTLRDGSHTIDCNTDDDQRSKLEALRQGRKS